MSYPVDGRTSALALPGLSANTVASAYHFHASASASSELRKARKRCSNCGEPPGMTGWELVSAVRSDPLLRDNPIIVTTAVPEEAPPGIDAVLQKPFDLDALVWIVERHCSRIPLLAPAATPDLAVPPD